MPLVGCPRCGPPLSLAGRHRHRPHRARAVAPECQASSSSPPLLTRRLSSASLLLAALSIPASSLRLAVARRRPRRKQKEKLEFQRWRRQARARCFSRGENIVTISGLLSTLFCSIRSWSSGHCSLSRTGFCKQRRKRDKCLSNVFLALYVLCQGHLPNDLLSVEILVHAFYLDQLLVS